jgi:hypothetical protein
MDQVLVKQLKQKVEEELRQREMALLEFWLKEVRAIEAKRHRELASLQIDLRTLADRMETRYRRLRGGPS